LSKRCYIIYRNKKGDNPRKNKQKVPAVKREDAKSPLAEGILKANQPIKEE
jgi:hypothetical protein